MNLSQIIFVYYQLETFPQLYRRFQMHLRTSLSQTVIDCD